MRTTRSGSARLPGRACERSESPPIIVAEPQTPSTELTPEEPILFD